MKIENTVFVSYRRSNFFVARSVYQDLQTSSYDVFLDYQSIDSGSFERIILTQISARAHFVVILTPTALERCINPNDWLRREIEHAIDTKRNIIPLMFDGFSFVQASPYLTGKLALLSEYNAINIPQDYFEEALLRLKQRFLNKPLDIILHPLSTDDLSIASARMSEIAVQNPSRTSVEEHLQQGMGAYKNGDYAKALTEFTEAIELYPNHADSFYKRGKVYRKLRAFEKAIADFKSAVDLEPRNHEFLYYLGLTYHNKNDLIPAIQYYSDVIKLMPVHLEAYFRRGEARFAREDYVRAVEDYQQVLKIESNRVDVQNRLAEAKKELSHRDNIVKRVARKVRVNPVDLFPESAAEYFERAKLQEDDDKKLEDLNAAIQLNPNYVQVYFERSGIYYHRSKFDKALVDDTLIVSLTSHHAAYSNRGEVYFALGQYQEALQDFQRALDMKTDNEYAILGLAITHHALEEHEKAVYFLTLFGSKNSNYKKVDWVRDKFHWHDLLAHEYSKLLNTLDAL